MFTLAIDTSTRQGSIAVLQDEACLGHSAESSGERYSVSLCSAVEALLLGHQLSLHRLDLFAVCAGPGSFTGLRVGLTAVKAWSEALGKPISPVSGLEALAERAVDRVACQQAGVIVPVLDARRGQVFAGVYVRREAGRPLDLVGEEFVIGANELAGMVEARASGLEPKFVSPNPEVVGPALSCSAFRDSVIECVTPILAPTIGLLGYRKALSGQVVDSLNLDANYVRRSDAEAKWSGR